MILLMSIQKWLVFFYNSGPKNCRDKFADGTELNDTVDTAEKRNAIQRNLDKLRSWAHVNVMKLNKVKSKVLHLRQGNPRNVC